MIYKKRCVMCGREFDAKAPSTKTCSYACRCEMNKIKNRRYQQEFYCRHRDEDEFKKKRAEYMKKYRKRKKDELNGYKDNGTI